MVLVSHIYKFIYIKNKKVAGSSVESFFGQFCTNPNNKYSFSDNIAEQKSNYGIIGARGDAAQSLRVSENDTWRDHKTALKIQEDLGTNIFDKYLKFCVIRNPYDAMVSYYYHVLHKKRIDSTLSFKDFAKKYKTENFSIYSINEKSVCNYYIRYENLKEDIIRLCKILNINKYDINDLPNHKSGLRDKNIHYRDFYDEETRKIVYKNHKNEFELFNYTF